MADNQRKRTTDTSERNEGRKRRRIIDANNVDGDPLLHNEVVMNAYNNGLMICPRHRIPTHHIIKPSWFRFWRTKQIVPLTEKGLVHRGLCLMCFPDGPQVSRLSGEPTTSTSLSNREQHTDSDASQVKVSKAAAPEEPEPGARQSSNSDEKALHVQSSAPMTNEKRVGKTRSFASSQDACQDKETHDATLEAENCHPSEVASPTACVKGPGSITSSPNIDFTNEDEKAMSTKEGALPCVVQAVTPLPGATIIHQEVSGETPRQLIPSDTGVTFGTAQHPRNISFREQEDYSHPVLQPPNNNKETNALVPDNVQPCEGDSVISPHVAALAMASLSEVIEPKGFANETSPEFSSPDRISVVPTRKDDGTLELIQPEGDNNSFPPQELDDSGVQPKQNNRDTGGRNVHATKVDKEENSGTVDVSDTTVPATSHDGQVLKAESPMKAAPGDMDSNPVQSVGKDSVTSQLPHSTSQAGLMNVIEPTDKDVIFGTSFVFNPGNKAFRKVVDSRLTRYRDANTEKRFSIVDEVVAEVHRLGGRFLDCENGRYYEVDNERARRKVICRFCKAASKFRQTGMKKRSWNRSTSLQGGMSKEGGCAGPASTVDQSSNGNSVKSQLLRASSQADLMNAIEPTDKDVFCGRFHYLHPGNFTFQSMVDSRVTRYRGANREEKYIIVREVIAEVHRLGGRFLHSENGRYYEADIETSRKKVMVELNRAHRRRQAAPKLGSLNSSTSLQGGLSKEGGCVEPASTAETTEGSYHDKNTNIAAHDVPKSETKQLANRSRTESVSLDEGSDVSSSQTSKRYTKNNDDDITVKNLSSTPEHDVTAKTGSSVGVGSEVSQPCAKRKCNNESTPVVKRSPTGLERKSQQKQSFASRLQERRSDYDATTLPFPITGHQEAESAVNQREIAAIASVISNMTRELETAAEQATGITSLVAICARSSFNCTSVIRMGGHQAIVRAMKHHSSAKIQEIGCEAIAKLSGVEGDVEIRNAIAHADGIPLVIFAMQQEKSTVGLLANGCLVLANLACNSESRSSIAKLGGLGTIINAMRLHPESAKLQRLGCSALNNLTCVVENKEAIVAAGGLEVVVSALRNFASSSRVTYRAFAVLASLANDSLRISADDLQAVSGAMQAQSDNERSQRQGCDVLYHLASNEGNRKLMKGRFDIQRNLLEAAERFPKECANVAKAAKEMIDKTLMVGAD